MSDFETGDVVSVCLRSQSSGAPVVDSEGAPYQCEQCSQDHHSGDHIMWSQGPEWGDPVMAMYDSVYCDGDIWFCLEHIYKFALEEGLTSDEIIHGVIEDEE